MNNFLRFALGGGSYKKAFLRKFFMHGVFKNLPHAGVKSRKQPDVIASLDIRELVEQEIKNVFGSEISDCSPLVNELASILSRLKRWRNLPHQEEELRLLIRRVVLRRRYRSPLVIESVFGRSEITGAVENQLRLKAGQQAPSVIAFMSDTTLNVLLLRVAGEPWEAIGKRLQADPEKLARQFQDHLFRAVRRSRNRKSPPPKNSRFAGERTDSG